MRKNEGRFPILWEPMHGLKLEISEDDIEACFGLKRIILRQLADEEQLFPIIGADQVLEPSTWVARKMAYYKRIDKPFRLNQAAGDELLNLLAGVKDKKLVGYSKEDSSYVLWPVETDTLQTSDFYN